jgi:hypothetical protein
MKIFKQTNLKTKTKKNLPLANNLKKKVLASNSMAMSAILA